MRKDLEGELQRILDSWKLWRSMWQSRFRMYEELGSYDAADKERIALHVIDQCIWDLARILPSAEREEEEEPEVVEEGVF